MYAHSKVYCMICVFPYCCVLCTDRWATLEQILPSMLTRMWRWQWLNKSMGRQPYLLPGPESPVIQHPLICLLMAPYIFYGPLGLRALRTTSMQMIQLVFLITVQIVEYLAKWLNCHLPPSVHPLVRVSGCYHWRTMYRWKKQTVYS